MDTCHIFSFAPLFPSAFLHCRCCSDFHCGCSLHLVSHNPGQLWPPPPTVDASKALSTALKPPKVESENPFLTPINLVNAVMSMVDGNMSVLCYSSRLISPILVVSKPCFKGGLVRQMERALRKHVEKINHLTLGHRREGSWKEKCWKGKVSARISLWSGLWTYSRFTHTHVMLMHKLTGISKRPRHPWQPLYPPYFKTLQTASFRLIPYLVRHGSLLNVSVCVRLCERECTCVCLSIDPAGQRKQMLREGPGFTQDQRIKPNRSQQRDYCSTALTYRTRKLVRLLYISSLIHSPHRYTRCYALFVYGNSFNRNRFSCIISISDVIFMLFTRIF